MPRISVILPCRNEEKTIAACIHQIKSVFKKNKIDGEIIVSDSSSDNSYEIAKGLGVEVVKHRRIGYGIAILKGLYKASGEIIVFADSDGTYDFDEIPKLINELDSCDLVIGNRLGGSLKKGAMPWHHRFIGNPLLSRSLNLLFKTKVSDAHSGFRAIRKEDFYKLDLKTTGMEFATEMIIKAAKNAMMIKEVPITYLPRVGESKMRSFRDGWRHLRFMLMFSPTYLFLIPGLILLSIGFILLTLMLYGRFIVQGADISPYSTLLGSFLTILGYQVINLGLYSRIYAIHTGFEKHDKLIDKLAETIPLEKGVIIGTSIIILSLVNIIVKFSSASFPAVVFSLTLAILGFQTFFSVFFISMMLIEKK